MYDTPKLAIIFGDETRKLSETLSQTIRLDSHDMVQITNGKEKYDRVLSEWIQASFIYGNKSDMNRICAKVSSLCRHIGYSLVQSLEMP